MRFQPAGRHKRSPGPLGPLRAGCASHGGVCQLATVALLTYGSNSTYEAGQISLSHRYSAGFSFNTSYWFYLNRCYTLRNNLETIVEAIRHLEGDHLFSDERVKSSPGESTSSDSATGSMEICQSPEGSPTSMQSQSMNEVQINFVSTPSSHTPQPSTSTPVSTTVTSLKHHVLNRIARTSEAEDQPMNLEFRPASRSPSPFAKNQMQQHVRPGVIVVKSNSF